MSNTLLCVYQNYIQSRAKLHSLKKFHCKRRFKIIFLQNGTKISLIHTKNIIRNQKKCTQNKSTRFFTIYYAGRGLLYRFSDTSQYDNVPTRLSTSASGTSRKQRDVSFADPRRSRDYQQQTATAAMVIQDEIEMLEECFDALKTPPTTTASSAKNTTTISISPNVPGYVKQTASNWPNSAKPVP